MQQIISELKDRLEARRDAELERISGLDGSSDRFTLILTCGRYIELELFITELELILNSGVSSINRKK